ncbi:three-helix bundle dimerization domain-containing protein [Catenulispora rubra]|uniref:three-helix bundle dimerization domain-containing protein n=1 Tax=Catenulispora rubra TaxID=280293 RepID=UPI00189228D8|nr:hypothetical protein [Catenulispora rubra]
MSALDDKLEKDAVDSVTARLAAVFGDVPRDGLETSVRRAYHNFDSSRVRTYVPLLVEHAVRDELGGRPSTTT